MIDAARIAVHEVDRTCQMGCPRGVPFSTNFPLALASTVTLYWLGAVLMRSHTFALETESVTYLPLPPRSQGAHMAVWPGFRH